ncbi:unnamed protein product [Amoebophrya sp. A25]|nr:unnamed protein product [Amoebophrya sp. A25]|eukprot:GSA25T00005617001.1
MHASVSSFGGSGGGKAPRPPMRDSAPSGIFPQASSMQQMSGNMQLASNGMGSGISGVNPGAAHLPPHAINGLEGAACPPHSFPPQHLNPGAGAMHPPGNTYSGPPSMGSNVDAPSMGSHPHGLSAAPVSGMTGPPGGGSVSSRGGYNVGPSAGSSRYHDAYNPEPRTAGDRRTDHYTGGGKELHMSGYAGGGGGKDYLGSHGGGKDYSEHPPRGKGGRKARNKGEHDYYDYRDRDGARGGDRMSGGPFGDQGGGYGSRGLKNNIISCPKRPVPLSAPTLVVPWAARPNACADLTSDEDDELLEIMMSPRRNMQLRLYYPQASMSAGFEQQLDEYERTGRIPHGTSMQTMVGGTNPRKRGEPLKLTAEGAIDWETDRDRGVPEDYKEFNGHAISQFKLDGDEDSQQVVPRGMKGQGRHNHRGAYNYDIPPMDGGASYYIGPQDVSHQLSFFRDPGLDPNPGTVWELYEDRGTVSIISDRDTVTWGAGPTMENYLEPWRYGLGGYGYSTGYGGYRGYNSASSDTRGGASMSGAGGSSGSTSSSYARAPDTRPPRSDRGGDMRKSDVPRKSEYSALPPREDQRWTSSSRRGENPAWQGRSRESGYSRENFYGGGGGQQDYSSGRPSTSSSGGYGKGRKQYPAPESSSTLVAKEQLNTSNVTAERTTSSLAYQ